MSKLPPSPRKLLRARNEGKVFKSQLLAAASGLALFAILLKLLAGAAWVRIKMLLEYIVLGEIGSAQSALLLVAKFFLIITGGWLILSATITILVELAQVGPSLKPGAVAPNLSRLNLGSGLRRVVAGAKEMWLLLLKLSIAAFFVAQFLRGEFEVWSSCLGVCAIEAAMHLLGSSILRFFAWGSLCLLALAFLEYWVNRYRYFRELSSTPEEARREHKEEDGDPLYRSYRRSQHAALSLQTIIARVKRSRVIVVEKLREPT